MKDLKGTKTEKNLLEAFAGESMARNKYDYFASKAKKDGYVQIAAIFEETAKNEKEHAKLWFKYLEGGAVKATTENLAAAAAGENFEWTDMYDRMAREAEEDREGARGALSQAVEEHRGRSGVLTRRRRDLALQQLRPHRGGQEGSRDVPSVQPSTVLLPNQGRELLIGFLSYKTNPAQVHNVLWRDFFAII